MNPTIKLCLQCNSPILPKRNQRISDVKVKKFCDSSCSAKYNNMHGRTGRKLEGTCRVCSKAIRAHLRYCNEQCRQQRLVQGSFKERSQVRQPDIRWHARCVIRKSNRSKLCEICGYGPKYIQVCHIKPVKDFPKAATLSEVNAISNLAYLCPTHHCELDGGDLLLPRVR